MDQPRLSYQPRTRASLAAVHLSCLVWALCLSVGQAEEVPLTSNQDAAINELAKRAIQSLKENNVSSVFVRNLRGKGSTEVLLSRQLESRLRNEFKIAPGGVEISGRLQAIYAINKSAKNNNSETPDKLVAGYQVSLEFRDPRKQVFINPILVDVQNDLEGHEKTAPTGVDRQQPSSTPGGNFITAGYKPSAAELISGSSMLAHPQSPYSISVLVENQAGEFLPRAPILEEDVPTIILDRRERYRVRIANESAYEAYAHLSIDGIGRFRLSEEPAARQNVDLVPIGKTRDLVGYYLNGQKAASFLVGSYHESVATKLLGEAPDIGTITVVMGISYRGSDRLADDEDELLELQRTLIVYRTETKTRQFQPQSPNAPTVDQPYTVTVPTTVSMSTEVQSSAKAGSGSLGTVVGTTDGPVVGDRVDTQSRKIGKVRATIRLRYHASN